MSRKQLKRAHIIRNYLDSLLSRRQTAEMLGMSERQVTRLAKGMKEKGESILIHKNTGRKPKHAITKELLEKILKIRQQSIYEGCNINHFKELLLREHEISISYTSLYNILSNNNFESPQKHKRRKKHCRRKRKNHSGELLQIDASPFEWFGGEQKYSLHGAIDDATGELTGLYLMEHECLFGYFEIMKQTCLNYGFPLSVYSDKHTIFRSPKTELLAEQGEEANLTQFGRALEELGTNIIYANSPQAKGRIERVWATLQSRLPVEFKINNITTIEEANNFLTEKYISLFNERFGVKAESDTIFVKCDRSVNLDHYLCIKESRKTDGAGVVSFKGEKFKVLDNGYPLIPARTTVTILVNSSTIAVQYKDKIFNVTRIAPEHKKEFKKASKEKKAKDKISITPYLKHSTEEWKKVWHYESYEDTLKFLYALFFKPVEHKLLEQKLINL